MTLREVQALLILYAAASEEAQNRAKGLLPGLDELVDLPRDSLKRWQFTAFTNSVNGGCWLGDKNVICRESELAVYKADYAAAFDLATNVEIKVEVRAA